MTLEQAVKEFLAVWRRRSKYHFADRELVAAVRALMEVADAKPAG